MLECVICGKEFEPTMSETMCPECLEELSVILENDDFMEDAEYLEYEDLLHELSIY